MILAELGVILLMGGWFYSTYLNNVYFQSYVNSLAPVLVPVLSVAFGIISATIATLLFGMRKGQQPLSAEEEPRRRPRTRRAGKKPRTVSGLKTTRLEAGPSLGVPKPRFVITSPTTADDTAPSSSAEKKESK